MASFTVSPRWPYASWTQSCSEQARHAKFLGDIEAFLVGGGQDVRDLGVGDAVRVKVEGVAPFDAAPAFIRVMVGWRMAPRLPSPVCNTEQAGAKASVEQPALGCEELIGAVGGQGRGQDFRLGRRR